MKEVPEALAVKEVPEALEVKEVPEVKDARGSSNERMPAMKEVQEVKQVPEGPATKEVPEVKQVQEGPALILNRHLHSSSNLRR